MIKPISLHIDYIKGYFLDNFHPFFDLIFSGMSPNSNYKNMNIYGIDFSINFVFTNSTTTALFVYNDFSVFSIRKNKDIGLMKHFEYDFNFYGSFFFFPDLKPFLKSFSLDYSDKIKLTRYDIAIDLPINMEYFLKKGYRTQFKSKTKINIKNKIPQTLYLGNKNSTNKKYFFRIYDKIADIEKKNKTLHYIDYYQYKSVLRIEVQINSQTVHKLGFVFSDLLNQKNVIDVFFSLSKNKNGTYFKILNEINEKFENKKISIKGNPKLIKDAETLLKLILKHINKLDQLPTTEHQRNRLCTRVNDL